MSQVVKNLPWPVAQLVSVVLQVGGRRMELAGLPIPVAGLGMEALVLAQL